MEQTNDTQINADDKLFEGIDAEEVEKIKASLAYEMTSVMLSLKGKFDRVDKESVKNEYLETEVGKPQLSYASPQIEVGGIACGLPETQITLGDPALTAEPVRIGAIPFDASAPELPAIPEIGTERLQAAVQVPVTAESFAPVQIPELPAADPEQMRSIIAGKIPEPAAADSFAGLADAVGRMPGADSIRIELRVETAAPPQCGTLPETEWNDIRVAVPETSVDNTLFAFPSAEISVAPVSVAAETVRIDESSFLLPPPEKVEIRIPYAPVRTDGIRIPQLPVRSITVQEYPEVPETPDFSVEISDILEAVKGEI